MTTAAERSAAPADREGLTVESIYRRHAADVARWAARLGGPRLEVEDAVQEVFTRVQDHLDGFRGEAKLTTWLFRITRNVVLRQRRRDRFRAFLRGPAEDAARELPAPGLSPEGNAEQRQARERIARALEGLTERQRTAIVLFELEDLSGEEVAERMGVSVGNLWVLLHRARAALLRRLEETR